MRLQNKKSINYLNIEITLNHARAMPLAIFMRHGEADNNVNRILVGRHIESHLTEIGRQQVRDTANYLKEIVIDKVFVSPVIRARETAEIVCDVINLDYEIDERLYEIEQIGRASCRERV